jgi:hypothetical protein
MRRLFGAMAQRRAALTIRARQGHRFVAMRKSIPGKNPKEAVSEKCGSSSGGNGFRGLREGRFGADDPPGKNVFGVYKSEQTILFEARNLGLQEALSASPASSWTNNSN